MNEKQRQRFWSKVDKTDTCWNWTRALSRWGYGISAPCYGDGLAHRASWVDANGPIPDGMFVCHHCDNPKCVRPSHLFLGTPHDNALDKVVKGRQSRGRAHGDTFRGHRHGANTHPEKFRGEGNCKAKLTVAQVVDIRARAAGRTDGSLAAEFGVSRYTINSIRRGITWRHVTASATG